MDTPRPTKRGVPADYDGSEPMLCNARTKSGRPCRALGLANGRCKWHGGKSTGARTPEGKARVREHLRVERAKRRLRKLVADFDARVARNMAADPSLRE